MIQSIKSLLNIVRLLALKKEMTFSLLGIKTYRKKLKFVGFITTAQRVMTQHIVIPKAETKKKNLKLKTPIISQL